MISPTLPTELLIEIFSTVSSPSDLYHSLQASKQLANVVRPFLYHHITIETQLQRERLKNVREEDKGLVRKVTIRGVGPITVADMDERSQSYRGGEGCVEELFTGLLLDISVIEILDITNLHCHPCEAFGFDAYLPAQKLVKLSISHQHGGARFWEQILARSVLCPSLETLIMFNLTCYYYFNRGRDLTALDSKVKSSAVWRFLEVGHSMSIVGAYPQLHVMVSQETHCSSTQTLDEQIYHLHLFSLNADLYRFYYDLKKCSCIRFLPDPPSRPIKQSHLARILVEPRKHPLGFLSIPFARATLSTELETTLTALEQRGTEVHCNEEEDLDSPSLMPQHFVDYVERMKRLKRKEELELGDL